MPKYTFIDYRVTQSGKNLTSDSAIKINRFDNKVSRIIFDLDGSIPDFLRLYAAFLNPKTGKYFYEPVLREENEYFIIIGTDISLYEGRWDMLLIATAPEYSLSGYDDIDETLVTYVSNTFKRISVLTNFLKDDAVAISFPTIDKSLDDLVIARETAMTFAQQTGEDAEQARQILQQCEDVLTQCNETLAECQAQQQILATAYQTRVNDLNNLYATLSQNLANQYEQCAESLRELGGG